MQLIIISSVYMLHLPNNNEVIEQNDQVQPLIDVDDDDTISQISDDSTIEAIDNIEILNEILAEQAPHLEIVPPAPYNDRFHFLPIERAPRTNISINFIDSYLNFQNNAANDYHSYLSFQTERLQIELRMFLQLVTNHILTPNQVIRHMSVRVQDELYRATRDLSAQFREAIRVVNLPPTLNNDIAGLIDPIGDIRRSGPTI